LHHYVAGDSLKRVVLRHFIPVPDSGKGSVILIDHFDSRLSLAKFYSFEGSEQALCLF
jgi:hypothetical protein